MTFNLYSVGWIYTSSANIYSKLTVPLVKTSNYMHNSYFLEHKFGIIIQDM